MSGYQLVPSANQLLSLFSSEVVVMSGFKTAATLFESQGARLCA